MDTRHLTTELKAQIVIQAVASTSRTVGESDAEFNARAGLAALDMAAALNDNHPVWQAVDALTETKAVVTGRVVAVEKEDAAKRVLVRIATGTSKTEDGTEIARTARWDTPVGRALAVRAHDLVGRDVVAWIGLDKMSNGHNVRMLRHILPANETMD